MAFSTLLNIIKTKWTRYNASFANKQPSYNNVQVHRRHPTVIHYLSTSGQDTWKIFVV